jgi:hypothetical protein
MHSNVDQVIFEDYYVETLVRDSSALGSNTVFYHFLRSAPPTFLLRPAPPPGAQLFCAPRPLRPCAPAHPGGDGGRGEHHGVTSAGRVAWTVTTGGHSRRWRECRSGERSYQRKGGGGLMMQDFVVKAAAASVGQPARSSRSACRALLGRSPDEECDSVRWTPGRLLEVDRGQTRK